MTDGTRLCIHAGFVSKNMCFTNKNCTLFRKHVVLVRMRRRGKGLYQSEKDVLDVRAMTSMYARQIRRGGCTLLSSRAKSKPIVLSSKTIAVPMISQSFLLPSSSK